MRMRTRALTVLLAAMLFLGGCARLYEGKYKVVTDHVEPTLGPETGDRVYEVRSYSGMKNAVQDMVNAAAGHGVIRAMEYPGVVTEDISRACLDVTRESPLGAYAVEYMTHTVSRILSYDEIEVRVNYKLSPEEIAEVRTVPALADMYRLVDEALTAGQADLAVQVVTLAVTERTLINYVEGYYREHPELLSVQPSVSVAFYPSEDYVQKIITFAFDYHTHPAERAETLAVLNETAQAGVSDLTAYTPQEASLASCLIMMDKVKRLSRERTAYDALVAGNAGPEGCAMAYKLLCDLCGVPCEVVTGRLNSATHYWNIIRLGRDAYHVDISACIGHTPDRGFLKRDSELWGSYWWDMDKYPLCQGELSYAQVAEALIHRRQSEAAAQEAEVDAEEAAHVPE